MIGSTFIVGYIMDVVIEKLEIFGPTLNPFFEIAGSGILGGLSITLAFVVSYLIQKILLKMLI